MEEIKCISLWQPWASLVALEAKKVETRHWSTSYRGPIAIHAAKHWTREEAELCATPPFWGVLFRAELVESDARKGTRPTQFMPLGAIVAVADLADCIPTYYKGALGETWPFANHSQQELAFGNYAAGRFGWIFKNIRALAEPIPYKGEQGLFNLPADLVTP